MLPAEPLELPRRESELGRDRRDGNGAREVLLHEQQRTAHARLGHGLRQRRVWLAVAPGARAVEQQHLAGLLRDGAPEMLLDEMGCQRGGPGAAGAGDARAVREEQAIGDHLVARKRLEKILVVIPADAGAPPLHQPGAAQDEAAGADADQGHRCRAHFAQVAHGRLVDLWSRVQDSADDDHVVEQIGGEQCARRLEQHATARRHRLRPARHDRPLHVQRTTAIALIGGETQVVDEHRKRRQSEMMRQDHPDAQRRARPALDRRESVVGA